METTLSVQSTLPNPRIFYGWFVVAAAFAVTFVGVAIALSPGFYGLVSDIAGTYRAIWGVLSVVIALAFIPALLIRE